MGFNLKVCEWILLVVRIFYHLQIMQLQFYCRRNFRSSNGIFPFVCTNLPASALPSGRGRFLTYSHGKWLPCEQGYIMICPHGTSVRIERCFSVTTATTRLPVGNFGWTHMPLIFMTYKQQRLKPMRFKIAVVTQTQWVFFYIHEDILRSTKICQQNSIESTCMHNFLSWKRTWQN